MSILTDDVVLSHLGAMAVPPSAPSRRALAMANANTSGVPLSVPKEVNPATEPWRCHSGMGIPWEFL